MKLRAAGHEVDSVKKDLERERTNGQAKAQKMARILAKSLEHINSLPPPADPTPYMSQLSEDELNEVMVHLDPVVATEMMKRFDVAISVGIIAQTAREQASALNSMDASHAAGILMQMDAAVRAMALASMDPGHVASMLDQLPMEDMVAFLNDLSLEKTTELLQAMDPNRHASPLPVVLACLPSPFPWPAPAPPPPPACVWPKRIRSTPSSL
ncbi:hypothetical protein CYMTET_19430 [Cymbomonas tetramitiformis]|uniref:Magnesium transporter MgtE intracellular domain-containing protein n=1 Tax=Cymbomonas tetramitiformis TaxID=36881 RepID=A0AAE0G673_9CHLO|nr:hypothetical protein CYMTET_19430 [Cymbomonas tetramitiformis]